jgi:hypothetical protein
LAQVQVEVRAAIRLAREMSEECRAEIIELREEYENTWMGVFDRTWGGR